MQGLDLGTPVADHQQHTDQARFGLVAAVFRPAVALGDPQRLAVRDHIVDVSGQMLRRAEETAHVARLSVCAEHLVGQAEIDHELRLHEVAAESDVAGLQPVLVQDDLVQIGVHHDIAVIGDVKRAVTSVDVLRTAGSELVDRLADDGHAQRQHHFDLELVGGLDPAQMGLEGLHVHLLVDELEGRNQDRVGSHALHGCRDFRIVIRTDIVELAG